MRKMQRHSDLPDGIVKEIVSSYGEIVGATRRSFLSICPKCGSEKFYIDKKSGRSVCFKASCDYGRGVRLQVWLALVSGLDYESANERIFGDKQVSVAEKFKSLLIDRDDLLNYDDELEEIDYPDPSFFDISHPLSSDAVEYLQKRGVPLDIAVEMQFCFKMDDRRLIMPIFFDGLCYGWQGRAIDPVDDKYRMRNNIGFARDSLVMFHQTISTGNYFVVAEGPFDAIKFYKAKHFIATLGKQISDKQLKLMCEGPASVVYVGLDADAREEAIDLCRRLRFNSKEPKMISVPESAIRRCDQLGKKADFGECTFDECIEALRQAKNPPFFKSLL